MKYSVKGLILDTSSGIRHAGIRGKDLSLKDGDVDYFFHSKENRAPGVGKMEGYAYGNWHNRDRRFDKFILE
jgi:hypothetical protein